MSFFHKVPYCFQTTKTLNSIITKQCFLLKGRTMKKYESVFATLDYFV